jgi:hypothetical protein
MALLINIYVFLLLKDKSTNLFYMNTLTFEKIIQETRANKNFPQKYLQDLYNYNMEFNLPVKSSGPLTSIKCFYPLPTRLLLTEAYTGNDKILKNKNEYQFHGASGNRIVFSDKKLPFVNDKLKYPIPFSFPIPSGSDIDIITSNVYYYEVTLVNKQNMTPWTGECVSIGFGHKNTHFHNHVGWSSESVGFHSDDGTIRYNESGQISKVHSDVWKPNDVAGAGIIYVGKNEVKPFFTLNGKLIFMMGKTIHMKYPYFPMVGYDHSHSIEVNFSSKPFVYDIKKLILKNSDNVISSDNTFICDYDIGHILNEPPTKDLNPKYLFYNVNQTGSLGPTGITFSETIHGNGSNSSSTPINNLQFMNLNGPNGLSTPINNLQFMNLNGPNGLSTPINNLQFMNLNGPNGLSILPNNLQFMNLTGSINLSEQPSNLIHELNIPENNIIQQLEQDFISEIIPIQNTESNNIVNGPIWNSLVFEGQNLFNFININSSPINSLTGSIQVNESNINQDNSSDTNNNQT